MQNHQRIYVCGQCALQENAGVTVFNARGNLLDVKLLRSQGSFEKGPGERASLTEHMIERMRELAKEDPLWFKECMSDFVTPGCFGSYRVQEYAMDKRDKIKYYVMPDGTCIVWAFTWKNFIF